MKYLKLFGIFLVILITVILVIAGVDNLFGNHSGRNECDLCGRSFPNQLELSRHVVSQHDNGDVVRNDKIACDLCDSTAPYMANDSIDLKQHIANEHLEDPAQLKCAQCGEKCSTAEELSRHTAEKHPIAPKFACDAKGCGQKFDTQLKLNNHKLSNHPWVCTVCHKKYLTKAEGVACCTNKKSYSKPGLTER